MTGPAGRGVTIVLVVGGASRMVRVAWPRWLRRAVPAWLTVGLLLLAGALLDYFSLTLARAAVPALERRAQGQQAGLIGLARLVESIDREVAGWPALYARLSAAFGPEVDGSADALGTNSPGAPVPPSLPDGGDSLSGHLDRLQSAVADGSRSLRGLEAAVVHRRAELLALPSRWPVRGPINSGFGLRPSPWTGAPEFHHGLDIGAPRGTPVMAPAAGRVVFAGDGGEYGLTVIVDHGNALRSLYGHLLETRVATEQVVQPGQVLALTGSSGRTSGPHLHYELQRNGVAVDPRPFLWN